MPRLMLCSLAVLVICTSCEGSQPHSASAVRKTRTGTSGLLISDSRDDRIAIGREARRLLMADEFDRLDSLADYLRSSRKPSSNGSWMLRYYYGGGFSDLTGDQPDWDPLILHIRNWRAARPQSITAPVALSYALVGWAWDARGAGYASTVTARGAQLMDDRLREAWQTLEAAARLPQRCPCWWMTAAQVALGQGWPPERARQLYEEAIAADPDCNAYAQMTAHHLLPRWYGVDGQWERFAAEAADAATDQDTGDARYAAVVWGQDRSYQNIFKESRASWERTRRGFLVLQRRYPDSIEIPSASCRLAVLAGDLSTAATLFDLLGNRCDLSVWPDAETFARTRAFIRSHHG